MTKKSLAKAFETQNVDKRIEVLKKIEETGSISQAARVVGISYKAAWQAIDSLTNLTGVCLVKKSVGGIGGGGAHLTADAHVLIKIAAELTQARQKVLSKIQVTQEKETRFAHLGIRTSMRNYLPCAVTNIETIGQTVRVFLSVNQSESSLVAKITKTSLELLALKKHMDVIAMCKAMSVQMITSKQHALDGKNVLSGKITWVSKGETGDEFILNIAPEIQIVGFAPTSKNIKVGDEISATVDESSVVLVLPP